MYLQSNQHPRVYKSALFPISHRIPRPSLSIVFGYYFLEKERKFGSQMVLYVKHLAEISHI